MGDINYSSFYDLKVEVLKKKKAVEEARKAQSSDSFKEAFIRSNLRPKSPGREAQRTTVKQTLSYDEVEAHNKSYSALESKSRLYDKLQRSELQLDEAKMESYLVDFDRKGWDEDRQEVVEIPTQHPNDPVQFLCSLWSLDRSTKEFENGTELIEYIDEFGRTRKIKASEKAKFDAAKEETAKILDGLLREQGLEPSHYDSTWEIRDKGIGFFAFAENEDDRQRQLQALNDLRKRTVEARAEALIAKEQRRLKRESRRVRLEERKTMSASDPESVFSKLLGKL